MYREMIEEWIVERDGSLETVQEAHKDAVQRWKNAQKKQEVLCGFPGSFRPLTRDEKKGRFQTPLISKCKILFS